MKNKGRILAAVFFFAAILPAAAGTIILEGNYQGKNVYVQNPFAGSGVGFCTYEVTVNGDVTTDEINSSAFEIDLTVFGLEVGQKVVIAIKHKDDCIPRVLNAEVLKPKSTFEVIDIQINDEGVLMWKTKGEKGALPFVVEQKRWNKWIKVGEVEGKGTAGINSYRFKVDPHSGENEFRVKQVDYTGVPRYSKSVRFTSTLEEVSFTPEKVKDNITFTFETLYEVYDKHGNIIKKGFGKTIDCTNLKKDFYYLSYDNKTGKFMKK